VSAPLAGKLDRIRLKPGDVLPQGRPVAVIEPTDPALLDPRALAQAEAHVKSAQAAVEKSGADLARAKAALDLAEIEQTHALELYQRNALPRTDLDVRLAERRGRAEELRAAQFAEEISRYELDLARAALARTRPRTNDADENARFEIPAPRL